MNKILPGFVICIALFLTACCSNMPNGSSTVSSSNSSAQTDSTYEPVETKEANTKTNKPAFEGQTRIAGVKTSTAYEGKMLTDALKKTLGHSYSSRWEIYYYRKGWYNEDCYINRHRY